MSGIKISQLPAVPSAELTDIFPVVQSGVTSQESISQVLSLIAPTQNLVYVNSATGNDTTGTGSAINPYKTITHTLSTITTNSTTNRFVILIQGIFSEATIVIKPFVSLVGLSENGSRVSVTGAGNNVTLDSSWTGGSISNIYNINFVSTNFSFNTSSISGSGSNITVINCSVINCTWTGRAAATDSINLNLASVSTNISVTDAFLNTSLLTVGGTSSLTSTSATSNITWTSEGDILIGNVSVSETSTHSTIANFSTCNMQGSLTVTGSAASISYDPVSYPQGGLTLASSANASTANTIQGTPIGSVTPSTGAFTTLSASGLISATASGIQSWAPLGTNTYTNTTYTFVLTDQDTYIRFSNSSAQTITVPANSSVAFPIGTEINGIQAGTGQVTFTASGGVTLNAKGAVLSISGQYGGFSLKKYGTDTWDLIVE